MFAKSPLAPASFPEMPAIAGVRLTGMAVGLKESGRPDLFMAELAKGSTIAGVLTRSACPSAPVDWCRKALPGGKVRGIVVNSGNANAFTGKAGDTAVTHTVREAARLLGCPQKEIFVASTGVIGVPVGQDYISRQLPKVHKALSPGGWMDACQAIMTTDTYPKLAVRKAKIGDTTVTISGMAKGSGMIAPDMATMLSFVFTDAKIPANVLQTLLKRGGDRSFNAITVDSDTSTSDTLLLAATGQAAHLPVKSASGKLIAGFKDALEDLLVDLATQVVKDGEGAQKFITIDVTGAVSDASARRVGLAIANSPLVKTAIAGSDANWGRIVMAVGKAGEKADRDKLSIAFGGIIITRKGKRVSTYDESKVEAHLKGLNVDIAVDLGLAKGAARVWTCDLTHGYIEINADYRT
jgi:glutamate N-acetyltransferase / amino-acid N-acetyltransferase